MQLHIVAPLTIETAMNGMIEFMPVVMEGELPSSTPASWSRFLKPEGKRIPLSPAAASKCQRYLSAYNSEALSEDGSVAFTIAGNALVECLPQNCANFEEELA